MACKYRLFDPQMVKQPDEIVRQVTNVVGVDRFRPIREAKSALIRSDGPEPCGRESGHLMSPCIAQLGKAVAHHDRKSAALLEIGHADAIGLCVGRLVPVDCHRRCLLL